jgi:hypothetical protein
MKKTISTFFVAVALCSYPSIALGKGLDDLSDQNPEVKAEAEGTTGAEGSEADEGAAETTSGNTGATNQEPVVNNTALANKLSFSTSFGWVYASRSKGDWRGSGMSDISVGYRYLTMSPKLSVVGTYRYAPVSIVGEVDGNSYRGVWESHYFGSKADYKLNAKTVLTGGLEAGYVLVYLIPTDGLETEKKHEENGVSISLGGGADYSITDNGSFTVGPRINAGFGSFTTVQVAASAGFMF